MKLSIVRNHYRPDPCVHKFLEIYHNLSNSGYFPSITNYTFIYYKRKDTVSYYFWILVSSH